MSKKEIIKGAVEINVLLLEDRRKHLVKWIETLPTMTVQMLLTLECALIDSQIAALQARQLQEVEKTAIQPRVQELEGENCEGSRRLARYEGKIARFKGFALDENPWAQCNARHTPWRDGWLSADACSASFGEGYLAFTRGGQKADCPYEPGNLSLDAWSRGWGAAKRDKPRAQFGRPSPHNN